MRVALYGASGKVGALLEPALRKAGHDVVDARALGPEGCDAAIDFTLPDVVVANVTACLAAGVPVVIGTTGFDLDALDMAAREAGVPCFHAPNFRSGSRIDDAVRRRGGRGVPTRRDRRAPFGREARRAVRHGEGHGRPHGYRPGHPLRPPARPRRAPGGHLRRRWGRRSRSGTTRPLARPSCPVCCSRSSAYASFGRGSRWDWTSFCESPGGSGNAMPAADTSLGSAADRTLPLRRRLKRHACPRAGPT